jgi:hypothetical protein
VTPKIRYEVTLTAAAAVCAGLIALGLSFAVHGRLVFAAVAAFTGGTLLYRLGLVEGERRGGVSGGR